MPETHHPATTVLHVGGVLRASSHRVLTTALRRRPGVLAVDTNPVAQTATVTYDPARTSVAELRTWVQECGYHCTGRSVPNHLCDPLSEPPSSGATVQADDPATTGSPVTDTHPEHDTEKPADSARPSHVHPADPVHHGRSPRLDKTGTLTKGSPEVTEVVPAPGVDTDRMLALAAAVERESEHPLAKAIVDYAKEHDALSLSATDFQNVPGRGATATGYSSEPRPARPGTHRAR